MTAYAELQVTSNFSFLRGGSHPEELVQAASDLGLAAISIADHNSFAGVVRAHVAAKEAGIKLLVGTRIEIADGPDLILYPRDRPAYARLTRLLTVGKRRVGKGECLIHRADLAGYAEGQIALVLAPETAEDLRYYADIFPGRCYLAGSILYHGDDKARLAGLADMALAAGIPMAATNNVHYHVPERRPLQDVLTCIREHVTVRGAGYLLDANAERYLKPTDEMSRLFRDHPDAIARTVEIADRVDFTLDDLAYEYPDDLAAEGRTVQQELEHHTWIEAKERYPDGMPEGVKASVQYELDLIGRLGYAPYFLTVYDMVRYARSQGILCQGRGSAANSSVCYCLGITAVDPGKCDLLFERFISEERGEPPDIDVDFEHERREEVIQYVYEKYGRHRAGLTATVICYRARSAVREVGKAMGLSADLVGALAGQVWGWKGDAVNDDRLKEVGLDHEERTMRQTLNLSRQLIGFPRHLSQHVGGFVIARDRLDELSPIENAAMEDRTVIEWDKDDLDALGILKVDVLSLGMLTCVRKGFDLLRQHYGLSYDLATLPSEDPAVYDMLCQGDSLGVFQVESRAQMAMLPRLKPRSFYDLVIEVAIVRPGPIQGDMVHPYLRRRNGDERVEFPKKELEQVLGKTLGVPLFQEQAMKIAIVAAGFTPSEADQLRRAMATFKKTGQIGNFRTKMIEGMVERDYERDFAERCFRQIEGFGNYGFPESHAASFALLVYVSAWMKRHYPEVFACALLNSQPMGFYAPAQIVRDARDHGAEVRSVDVNCSDWDCTLEEIDTGGFALRLGFRQIKGFRETDAEILVACRAGGYRDPKDLWRRAGLSPRVLERLARGDAYRSMGISRRKAFWAVRGLQGAVTGAGEAKGGDLPLFAAAEARDGAEISHRDIKVNLPSAPVGEEVVDDYASLRLSLKAHPIALLRDSFAREGYIQASKLLDVRDGQRVRLAGLVLVRQRPGTAKGVIFITLEDETGVANLIVWPDAFEKFRRSVLSAKLMGIRGRVQREGIVIHVIVEHLEDYTDRLEWLTDGKVDKAGFDGAIARADEAKRNSPEPKVAPSDNLPLRAHPRRLANQGLVKRGLGVGSRDFH